LSYLVGLECSKCGKRFGEDKIRAFCDECGGVLLARYDLDALDRALERDSLKGRDFTMWRYRELLPVRDDRNIVSLGEGNTPLIMARNLGENLGIKNLWIKDESWMPGGNFKTWGASAIISKAKELNIKRIAMGLGVCGNMASSLCPYAARAGIKVYIFASENAPWTNIVQCWVNGARVYRVKAEKPKTSVDRELERLREMVSTFVQARKHEGWVNPTLLTPYRLEGKKARALELAEQFDWSPPDVILQPTGSGGGILGSWKGFEELKEIGWIDGHLPRMFVVQGSGFAPYVKAFKEKKEECERLEGGSTIATGLMVNKPVLGYLVLRAIRESGGGAVGADDEEILEAVRLMAKNEGVFPSHEGATTLAALRHLIDEGSVDRSDRVVLFNTATGLKYTEKYMQEFSLKVPVLDLEEEIDFREL